MDNCPCGNEYCASDDPPELLAQLNNLGCGEPRCFCRVNPHEVIDLLRTYAPEYFATLDPLASRTGVAERPNAVDQAP